MNISIFGTGYVGLVTGASLANLGHKVLCVDLDEKKIALLEQGEIPFYEPGLKELVIQNQKRLSFTTNAEAAVHFGEVLFNCVWTPSKEDGSADLSAVFQVIDVVARHARKPKLLVNKSTVPPGTARKCQELLRKASPAGVEVVSNPEFTKQGNAVYDFNHPDKIVVGAASPQAFAQMRKVYHGLVKMYIPSLEMDWETAEMAKYANNAFLATKISFINEIAALCSAVGADVKEVAKAIGADERIGPKFLNAGIGYGGSCFQKDVKAVIAVGKERGYLPALLQEVEEANERQKKLFIPKILNALREVQGDTVTMWGLSFKPKTSDIRGAPSLVMISALLRENIKLKVYDPVAMPEVQSIYGDQLTYCSSVEESVTASNVVVLATEWDEFRNVHFSQLGKAMKSRILFDGRNIFDPVELKAAGFQYYGVGRGGV